MEGAVLMSESKEIYEKKRFPLIERLWRTGSWSELRIYIKIT